MICDELYALTELGSVVGGVEGGRGQDSVGFTSALNLTEPLVREGAVKVDGSRVHVVWSASKIFWDEWVESGEFADILFLLSHIPDQPSYPPTIHTSSPTRPMLVPQLSNVHTANHSLFIQGCLISQLNTPLLTSTTLLTHHPSLLSTSYLTSLLTWSQLPTLLALNTSRLTTSYHILTSFLRKHNIAFVPPTHGLFVWARLAGRPRSAEEERNWFEGLEREGVRVYQGRGFKGVEGGFGWGRVRVSVREGVMREAVERMEPLVFDAI